MATFERLTARFGAPPAAWTASDLLDALARREDEAEDLDFKRGFYTGSDATNAVATDVTAMANTGGGVIVLGMDDEGARASAAPGVVPLEVETMRMRNAVDSLVEPRLDWITRPIQPENGRPGFYVLIVPPGVEPLYAVRHGASLRYSVRSGPGNRHLNAAEVRARFETGAKTSEQLTRVESTALSAIQRPEGSTWLSVTLSPGNWPLGAESERRFTQEYATDFNSNPWTQDSVWRLPMRCQIMPKRLVVEDEHNVETWRHYEFWEDGSSSMARLCTLGAEVDVHGLVVPALALVEYTARHARRAGGVGGAELGMRLETTLSPPMQLELVVNQGRRRDVESHFWQQSADFSSRAGVDFSTLLDDPSQLLRTTRGLLTPIFQGFGVPEVSVITPEGKLARGRWPAGTLISVSPVNGQLLES